MTPMKLVTVVAEAALERRLIHDFANLGVRGWTVTQARGHGLSGDSLDDMIEGGNVRIEVLAPEDTVGLVLERLRNSYFERWGVVAWVVDAEVIRSDHFR